MTDSSPLNHPICLLHPIRLAESAWIEHIPFGLFLVDLLRPQTIVELGTFTGVSYCAFCQAVRELQLPSKCWAVDTWLGDPHNGFYGSEVLADLRQHHDPLYSSFSQLIQSTFDDALSQFNDGTIDLLHIDGYHTYESVAHDFRSWLVKMSARGVILFHGTGVRDRDFGVWRLWEEVRQQYPHFELPHGSGLGLLAVGQEISEALLELLDPARSPLKALRQFFKHLGRSLENERASARMLTQLCSLQDTIASLSASLKEANSFAADCTADLARTNQEAEAQRQEHNRLITEFNSTILENQRASTALLGRREAELARITSSRSWRILGYYWFLVNYCRLLKRLYLRPLRWLAYIPASEPADLRFQIDTPIPKEIAVGPGNAIYVCGWCYHPQQRITQLDVVIDGVVQRVNAAGIGRQDVLDAYPAEVDPWGFSFKSGFWTIVSVPQVTSCTEVVLQLRATLRNGAVYSKELGRLKLNPVVGPGTSLVGAKLEKDKKGTPWTSLG